jgi:RimJ/RimL family protein N-acetyltransferase
MSFGWAGEKIRLVPLDKARHFENMLRWLNDPDVTARTLVGDFPIGKLTEEAWFDRCTNTDPFTATDVVFALETLDGTHIGVTGIHAIEWRHGAAKTGTLIGPAECRGKGYGSEAVVLRTRYGFEVLGLRLLISEVFDDNTAIMRVLEKAGYQRVGIIPKRFWKRGAYRDLVTYAIYREPA